MTLVYPVVLVILALSLPPRAAGSSCLISDCSLPSGSNCSWDSFVGIDNYLLVNNKSSPPLDDPEHLFNLLQDPLEEDCVFLQVYHRNMTGELIFMLTVSCRSQISDISKITFQVNSNQSNSSASNYCLERDSKSMKRAKQCGIFANVQLKLTFLGDDKDQLLLEDLSAVVPSGTSLLLRKVEFVGDKRCSCRKLTMFWIKKHKCMQNALKEIV
uniref:(northern house mosquito) hypothetical protein n=1 Tax=Culex pipiens TaxID=7175 RepID=A0A8D8BTC1_CULPI